MTIRDRLSQQPVAAAACAVAALLFAGWMALGRSRGPTVDLAWYYDLDAGRLTVGEVGHVPPFTAADGHTLVRAAVFTCGDCAEASSRCVAYLEKYSDAYRRAMGDPDAFTPEVAEQGQFIRAADGEAWHAGVSAEGARIVAQARQRCGVAPPKVCHP